MLHASPASPVTVFLDCDPGIDDAVALGYLLCQPDVRIAGIAASGGNVPTAQVLRNTLGWLKLAGRDDIEVFRGADGPSDAEYAEATHGPTGAGYAKLPRPTAATRTSTAAEGWAAAARAHPGQLVGVLIGPATNLALALDIEPDLPHLLKRLFIMGGAFNHRGNTRPTTEWNTNFDPEATARVLSAFGDAERKPVIAPLEATEAIVFTPERLADLLSVSSEQAPAGWQAWLEQLAAALRFYFEFHESDGFGYIAHLHDPFVVAAAVEWARRVEPRAAADAPIPWAHTRTAPVDVELTGTLTRGETVADWLGRWDRPDNAEIVRRLDAPAFLDHLSSVLQKGPRA